MALNTINPTQTKAWKKLEAHFEIQKNERIQDAFQSEKSRFATLSIHWEDFLVDYSKNRLSTETLSLLQELAEECGLKSAIESYFDGDAINQTEDRAVLHTALRAQESDQVFVDGLDVIPEIFAAKEKISQFTSAIISGNHKGFTGKAITDVVNIGIGGSDLGPAMIVEGLEFYKNHLNTHFVSNVEGDHVHEILKN
jgi:Glucose-6-phosphate isomerase